MNISSEIEKQLKELSGIDKRVEIEYKIITRSQVLILITLDKSLIKIDSIEYLDHIRFVLLLKPNYPRIPPLLYCVSRFCIPELSDGRDYLEDTLQMKWNPNNCFLKLIISQIPSFVNRYLQFYNKKEKNNNNILFEKRKLFGKYYLDSIYEVTIIKYIPYLYFDIISEIVSIKGKKMNLEDRKILITDNFVLLFCNKNLYDLDQLKLIFVGPITSLVYIKQLVKDGIILLKWAIKGKGIGNTSFYTMQLKTKDGDYIVDTLIENLSQGSIDFKVTNKVNGNIKREGSVPMVDINLVEEKVKQTEAKISKKEDITKESISSLVNLYEKAIQYYSALNNEKFKVYIKKLHEIYSNNEFTSLLNMKTISNADNQYNVAHFKRKRKKNDEDNKKKKEKKSKKKPKEEYEKDIIDKSNNEIKVEDKKEEKINKINDIINNENEQKNNDNDVNKNKELKSEENNNIAINGENNDIKDNSNNNLSIKGENEVNNKETKEEDNKEENKEEKKEEEKDEIKVEKEEKKEVKKEEKKVVENKKEIKENRTKRNLKKKEEGKKAVRKNRNNTFMDNEKKQKMLIDKKEIEEMIKNELNMKNLLNPTENPNDSKIEINKEDHNKEKQDNKNTKENGNENK